MRCWLILLTLSHLVATAHSFLTVQPNPTPSRAWIRGRRSNDRNAVSALSAARERRTNSVHDVGSASPSPSSAQEQQLIDNEEAARSTRAGQVKRRKEKLARMEDRVSYLESLAYDSGSDDSSSGGNDNIASTPVSSSLSDAQRKELEGLLRTRDTFEEQYDPSTFTKSHVEFKRLHNDAFVALARFCQRDRRGEREQYDDHDPDHNDGDDDEDDVKDDGPNVFYLDGPDGATSSALEKAGFHPSRCYVANRHLPTCRILRDRLPEENVVHCTAAEALSPNNADTDTHRDDDAAAGTDFSKVDFSAYYFDGCGGFVPHVVGMMTAALVRSDDNEQPPPELRQEQRQQQWRRQRRTIAVGFSLMGGNRDVVEKELTVCRALAVIARTRGMRTRHVMDDPGRYGIPMEIAKTEGGTFTSWMLLEEN
eukprot:CAMPEP_0201631598 /NCGR_PEP_ID=MMETSP0493-20130528/5523_1 /ASSEMBLY_ACC=CAM_ASM_000838 /TAXON_ID=420259 /ORGANISM="Thalassiosira gravida, Strain GMp14c1" /LENGTH=423 /DNA_ID=CAMNT_0048102961 /DNA_START=77 /DNA_END=1348 /DNA_ORIENTATION=-